MALLPEAEKIKKQLDAYLAGSKFAYNPDASVVERVINGLALREQRTGKAYCPCRLVKGKPDEDAKIICPCVYHAEEIASQGMCHCQLFVAKQD